MAWGEHCTCCKFQKPSHQNIVNVFKWHLRNCAILSYFWYHIIYDLVHRRQILLYFHPDRCYTPRQIITDCGELISLKMAASSPKFAPKWNQLRFFIGVILHYELEKVSLVKRIFAMVPLQQNPDCLTVEFSLYWYCTDTLLWWVTTCYCHSSGTRLYCVCGWFFHH